MKLCIKSKNLKKSNLPQVEITRRGDDIFLQGYTLRKTTNRKPQVSKQSKPLYHIKRTHKKKLNFSGNIRFWKKDEVFFFNIWKWSE